VTFAVAANSGTAVAARVRGLCKVFGATVAVEDVDLDIPDGAVLGMLGPNGSGKTTLLRVLSGALRPHAGHVTLDDVDLARWPRTAIARRVAVVPQETHLAFDYTVLELALMGRYPHLGAFEVEGPGDIAAALAALEATGTAHLAARSFQTLSGGEKQRVVIASALAQLQNKGDGARLREQAPSPSTRPLLFLDEPTASLDLHYQIETARLIRRLHDSQNVAIVLSTHDLRFASAACDRVVLLREGRVLANGPTREVLTPAAISALYDVDAEVLAAW